jgi:hypothetical protein
LTQGIARPSSEGFAKATEAKRDFDASGLLAGIKTLAAVVPAGMTSLCRRLNEISGGCDTRCAI